MKLTESRQKALDNGRKIFQMGAGNLLYQKWRSETISSFAFYDGHGQYPEEVLQKLKDRGQAPIVINKVKSMINQASGLEINTRTKIAYRSHSGKDEEEFLAKGLTHLGFAIQEQQNFSYQGSLRSRDAMICGVGFVHMYPDKDNIIYEYLNPLNVIYDADDFSPQLTKQRYLINMHWMSLDDVKSTYPGHISEFNALKSSSDMYDNVGNFSQELFNRNSAFIPNTFGSTNGSRLLVNELFHKESRKYYCGNDKNGYYFETFDENTAEDLAGSMKDVITDTGTQIMRTVFCGDILLEFAPLEPNIPNLKDFPTIPAVWGRRTSDAVPVGWLEDMKDVQREINYRKLKYLMALNSVRAIIDPNAFHGMDADQIRDELSRPDSILFKSGNGQVDIVPNVDLAASYMQASERSDYELQQVSGMYSDSLGQATNATSGVAIKQRQIGTSKNLAAGFDTFSLVKKREGEMLLNLIQNSGLKNILVNVVLDNDEKEELTLNLVREIDGKEIIMNDIRTIPVDIYVERVPDFDSSPEEMQENLQQLLANPQAPLILQNPELLKLLRFRDHDKIATAMQALQQQQNQQEAMLRGGGGEAPQANPAAINPTALGGI
jgi:hypothetical protein